ncbi:uncharacterized protein BO95DRAFT_469123 [Aspergillus brunneoviolaceus CBS 621.78]|uniref:Uncharacterized protein n=1 Tax=Aspergillus brunneoviolaceus CBS 621.78 TaxID=1450534 RepID=A0ACD1FSX6_9EURO|nr:hypothetical protein BO95DRAFT_469123 [Aspergillus brunneoviolaceus CBS 621.78]RAH40086.1 hypothetical protein BO95DRAFT_469123 [Aspergillus brunneoviolaceus CBS 621.78]
MSPPTFFPRFSNLPFELREPIWLFSLDELAMAPGRHGADYRQRISHLGVNREVRAAASKWVEKQKTQWVAVHQSCEDPQRCATWFDWNRKVLSQPRLLFRESPSADEFFLSQAEYERCCDVLGRSSSTSPEEGQHRPGVGWKVGQLWLREPICKYQNRRAHSVKLAVPLALLRRNPDALRNIILWASNEEVRGFTRYFIMFKVTVNELPHHGECMTVQEGWKLVLKWPIWTRVTEDEDQSLRWKDLCGHSRRPGELIGAEAWSVIEHAMSRLDPGQDYRIVLIRPMRAVRHGESVELPTRAV